ncbi:uncharacterized protein [Anabrus simplex]|uniref:uncharacterized protein n=1 Tax=Anabrus simplex TaxID=316456 RepID=UPI0035A3976F
MAAARTDSPSVPNAKSKKNSSSKHEVPNKRRRKFRKKRLKPSNKEPDSVSQGMKVTKGRITVPHLPIRKGWFLRGKGTDFVNRGKKGLTLNVLNKARLDEKLHDILNLAEGVVDPLQGKNIEADVSPPISIIQQHNTSKIEVKKSFEDVSFRSSEQTIFPDEESSADEEEEYQEFLKFIQDISNGDYLNCVAKTDYIDDVQRKLRSICVQSSSDSRVASRRLHSQTTETPSPKFQHEEVQWCSADVHDASKGSSLSAHSAPSPVPICHNTDFNPSADITHEEINTDSDNGRQTPVPSSSDLSLSNLNAIQVLKKQFSEEVTPEEELTTEPEEVISPEPELNPSFREQNWPSHIIDLLSSESSDEECCINDFQSAPSFSPSPLESSFARSPLEWKVSNTLEFIHKKPNCVPSPDIRDIYKRRRRMY